MQLSIIIPVYNVELYLRDCLNSLIQHVTPKHFSAFELIIINDGSTDRSLDIANEYSSQYSFVKLISKPNGGLSDARNVGLEVSKGRYISFIDSDDVIKKEFINDILMILEDKSPDIISFDINKFFGVPEFSTRRLDYLFVNRDFYCSKPLIACNKIYKRKLFENIKFPVSKYYEDVWTTPSLILSASTFIHINNDYYGYRQRHGSITANIDSKYMDILGALNIIAMQSDNFVKNVLVSQFFTLVLLSLRLPFNIASRNLDLCLDFFLGVKNVKPYNNKVYEKVCFSVFSLLKRRSKAVFLLCKPLSMLQLYIKNYKGK